MGLSGEWPGHVNQRLDGAGKLKAVSCSSAVWSRPSVLGHGVRKPRQEKTGQLQGKRCNSGGFCVIRLSSKLSFTVLWSVIRHGGGSSVDCNLTH